MGQSSAVRAVIFDMDGVLIDSEPHWQAAEIAVFAEVGVPLTHADCAQTTGLRMDDAVAYWFARRPWTGTSLEQVEARVVVEVCERIRTHGEALPGALEAVRFVQEGPWQLALATSSAPVVIDAVFARLGLSFDVVCSATEEARGKPDPAVYLTAARRLGVAPAHCVAIEDSRTGVQSALSAGMTVIAVEPGTNADLHLDLVDLPSWLNTESRL